MNLPSNQSGFSLNLCSSAYLIPVTRSEVQILFMSMSRFSLKVSHSDGLRILTSNFSEDLTMALKMPVKFMSRLNGFSMGPYILTFENKIMSI